MINLVESLEKYGISDSERMSGLLQYMQHFVKVEVT